MVNARARTRSSSPPGLIIGRIPIYERVGLTFGAGYQVAVTKKSCL
jgi:hypothetical protein